MPRETDFLHFQPLYVAKCTTHFQTLIAKGKVFNSQALLIQLFQDLIVPYHLIKMNSSQEAALFVFFPQYNQSVSFSHFFQCNQLPGWVKNTHTFSAFKSYKNDCLEVIFNSLIFCALLLLVCAFGRWILQTLLFLFQVFAFNCH